MGIVSITTDVAGQTGGFIGGVVPRRVAIVSTDNLATVTTAGYLNNVAKEGFTIFNTDIIDMWYGFVPNGSPGTYDVFTPSISNGIITLVPEVAAGNVLLPVVSGDFAIFNGATGQIKDLSYSPSDNTKTKVVMAGSAVQVGHIGKFADVSGTLDDTAGTAINDGNIQAGRSGLAGILSSLPSGAASGALNLSAVTNASGNFNTSISNASAVGQSQVITIPDSGGAAANFILSASGSAQTIAGGLTVSTGDINVSLGNVIAGSSGNAGKLASFPAGATSGELFLSAVTNGSGNFSTTISNAAAVGQSQVISIPDSGAATANFVISSAGSPQTIAGGLIVSTGNINVSTGNLVAGSSGNAGTVSSFPAGATSGELLLSAVTNATGNFSTTISNAAAIAQSQVISIPDSGAVSANFILSKGTGVQSLSTGLSFTGGGTNIQTTGGGNFLAGASGAQGFFVSYPAAPGTGRLIVEGAANAGNFDIDIINASFGQASVLTIPDPGMAASDFVLSQSSVATNNVAFTKVVTATFTALAAAGKVNVVVAPSVTSQFAILDLKVLTSTGLSGGGGDRLLALSDATIVFNGTGITAALLGTPIFTLWGAAGNPIASGASQVSTAGANIFLQYTGGTTDYIAGDVVVAVTLVQVTA